MIKINNLKGFETVEDRYFFDKEKNQVFILSGGEYVFKWADIISANDTIWNLCDYNGNEILVSFNAIKKNLV